MSTTDKKKSTTKKATTKKAVTKKAVKKKVSKKKASTARKSTVKKASVKKKTAKKAVKKKVSKSVRGSKLMITPEERWRMIAVAAYHKAEKRNFAPGSEFNDWIDAEKEIDKLLGG